MKLYYTPGVCSLSPHIVLSEADFDYELEKVDLKTKITETGKDFNEINKKSGVPVLQLENGEYLTEGVAIVQFLADQKPEAQLVPENGTLERAKLQEWLNYISSEMHKSHFPLFHSECGEDAKRIYLSKIKKSYDFASDTLKENEFIMGDKFSVADAYLYTIINWHNFIDLDLSPWPVLVDYQERVSMRPKVQRALKKEGLLN